jgi:hypothetical protein
MRVDRHGDFDLQFIDDDLARTIGKAPTARCTRLKEDPRSMDLIRRKEMNPAHMFAKQGSADFESKSAAFSRRKKGKRLIHAIVGGNERFRIRIQECFDLLVTWIRWHMPREPSACID